MNAARRDFSGKNGVRPSDLMTVVNQPDDAQNLVKAVELTNEMNTFMRNLVQTMKEVQTHQIRFDNWKKYMKSKQGKDHDSSDKDEFDPTDTLFDNDITF